VISPPFVHAIEEREHVVIVLVRNRIVLVVMTTSAFQSQSKNSRSQCVDAIGNILGLPFKLNTATFVGLAMESVERCCQSLLASRAGKQVAGNLPLEELVVRQVVVDRFDNPVTIGPSCSGVLVSRRLTEQTSRVVASKLIQKVFDLVDGRRQPCQIKSDPTKPLLFCRWR